MTDDKSDIGRFRNRVFQLYQEASTLFNQGDYEEALARFNQVVFLGGNWPYDDMISGVVNAALKQKKKCQYRLLKF